MCIQDLAISRRATIKQTDVTGTPTVLKIPANPDRIAVWPLSNSATGLLTLTFSDPSASPSPGRTGVTSLAASLGAINTQFFPGIVTSEFWITLTTGGWTGYVEAILDPYASVAVQEVFS